MKIVVTSASGIEAVTKRELFKVIGKEDVPAINGRMAFEGTNEDICKCNLLLRTANRVMIVVGEFRAETFDELFENTADIRWEDYLPSDAYFPIEGKSQESKLFAVSACQSIVKKAIIKRLSEKYKTETFPENGDRYKIEISVVKDIVTLTLDTSGAGLHRRGYRGLVGEAPIKETLASALIELSVWNPDRPFADLFCGSGTFPIEACLIALNIPSGRYRDFDFLHWKNLDFSSFKTIKEEAESKITMDKEVRIQGFDIDEKQISIARHHAELAGIADHIHLQQADMRAFSSRFSHGIIISNPPYGERMLSRNEIEVLYRDYGKIFSSLDDWSAYTLTNVTDFEKLFGRRADKKRKIYNGKIECNYYQMLGAKPHNNIK